MTATKPYESKKASLAIVIITNGPGELSTWVRPLVEKLKTKFSITQKAKGSQPSLNLVLVPCPNATGKEYQVARKMDQFENIIPAKSFWNLLLNPDRFGFWPKRGLVIFLGGDQFWSVLLSARLGYKHLTYAEWIVRWPHWNDRIAVMSPNVKNKLPRKLRKRCIVVGDLMADINRLAKQEEPLPKHNWIALMPGSKKAKLCVGVPFLLDVADHITKLLPEFNFLLPLAPTTNLSELQFFSSFQNPIAAKYESRIVKVLPASFSQPWRRLITQAGAEIHLIETHPAHGALSQCDLALTTVGANTAELGALGVPMIVIVPTQHLEVMQAWDGFIGLLARLPGLKWFLSVLVSTWRLRNHGFLAWPNITAGKMIVPEKVGEITPEEIAKETASWIRSPNRLKGQREDLRSLRGKPGAIAALTEEVINLLRKA